MQRVEARRLLSTVSVTANSFDYRGQYGGQLQDYDYKYIFNFTFNADVSQTVGDDDLFIDQITGGATDAPPSFEQDYYWDSDTNTETFAVFADQAPLPNGNYRASLSHLGVYDANGNQLDKDYIIDFKVLAGDATGDGSCNVADLGVLATNYGQPGTKDFSQGDFNYDSTVDVADLGILATNYGATIANPPTAPDELRVDDATTQSLTLTWQDVQPSATGYRIERSTDGENFSVYQNVVMSDPSLVRHYDAVNNVTNISWMDNNVLDGTRYFYRVRAYDDSSTAGLNTAYTPKSAATTSLAVPLITGVTDLSAHYVKIDWTPGSAQDRQFFIYRQLAGNAASAVKVGTVSAYNTFTFTDKTAHSGTAYQYYVSASNYAMESAGTTPQSVTTMTLAQDIVSEVNSMIAGKTPSQTAPNDTQDIYSSIDDVNGTYTRNPNFIGANVDLSCLPVWESQFNSAQFCGCLVTPRTLIGIGHAHLEYGDVRFVSATGEVVVDQVIDHELIPEQPGDDDGIEIVTLEDALPPSIKPANIFSEAELSSVDQSSGEVPIVRENQFRQFSLSDMTLFANQDVQYLNPSIYNSNSVYQPWNLTVQNNDSGSPLLEFIDSQPVFMAPVQTGASGVSISYFASEVNTEISYVYNELSLSGPNYQMSIVSE